MKKVLFVLLMFISTFSYSQQFDGVSISGSLPFVIKSLEKKGYVFNFFLDDGAVMTGKIANENVEVFIKKTLISKKVYRIYVFFEKQNDWFFLKKSYKHMFNILFDKYHSPDNQFSFFHIPYKEGDNLEYEAVSLGKCGYSAFWFNRNNLSISITIYKTYQICIDYVNESLAKLNEKEELIIYNKKL